MLAPVPWSRHPRRARFLHVHALRSLIPSMSWLFRSPPGHRLSLALQGGGAHGAFTWGVLDALLGREEIDLRSVSGASAELDGANITLLADSTVTITNSNFNPGSVRVAFAISNADANVNITAGRINASGNLSVEAKSTVTSTLTTVPDNSNS